MATNTPLTRRTALIGLAIIAPIGPVLAVTQAIDPDHDLFRCCSEFYRLTATAKAATSIDGHAAIIGHRTDAVIGIGCIEPRTERGRREQAKIALVLTGERGPAFSPSEQFVERLLGRVAAG